MESKLKRGMLEGALAFGAGLVLKSPMSESKPDRIEPPKA